MSYGKEKFDYARGYYMIFPPGFEKGRKIGAGSLVIEEDYTIYFKEDTPEDIKKRFVSEYAEYHSRKKEEQARGIFIDT